MTTGLPKLQRSTAFEKVHFLAFVIIYSIKCAVSVMVFEEIHIAGWLQLNFHFQ